MIASGTFVTDRGTFFIETGLNVGCAWCSGHKRFLILQRSINRTALSVWCADCFTRSFKGLEMIPELWAAVDKIKVMEQMEVLGDV